MTDKARVGMISLGCDKNRVDSERMLFRLKQAGYIITQDEREADVMVVNTCAFIDKAKKEAIDTILETAKLKEKRDVKLVVTGCFANRYASVADLPEVDAYLSVKDEDKLVDLLDEWFGYKSNSCLDEGRILTTPAHYAYLKIADGCNNRCSYCAIPSIRGKYVSVPMEKLVAEAAALKEQGVEELILVAQDTTNYGKDLYGERRIVPLLKELTAIGFWRVRLLYAYPELITDELLDYIENTPNMAKYLDIPLQHVNTALLKRMNRRSDGESIRALLQKIRAYYGDIAVRSTFIAGFPGETEEMHEELNGFVKDGLNYAGFFVYSKEEGTLAYDYKPSVPKSVARKWVKELEITQCMSTKEHNFRYLNTVQEVIYEGIDYSKKLFYGRNEYNAPDVDTQVYFTSEKPLDVGRIYKVKITGADFHLYGEVTE